MLMPVKSMVKQSLRVGSTNNCLPSMVAHGKSDFGNSASTAPIWGSFPLKPAALAAGPGKEISGYSSQQVTEKWNNRKGYFSQWVKMFFSPH